jgi:hypothetical protein
MSSLPPYVGDRLRRFVRKLKKIDLLSHVFGQWNGSGEAYLFGGAPRDVAFGAAKSVNDLDIFVSGPISIESLDPRVTLVKRTNFGGYRLLMANYEVDVWELDKSYAFRFDASSYISAMNLLHSVCFSTDGVAISLKTGRVLTTSPFIDSLEDRRLDFVVPPLRLESVVAARIARLALKLDLELTPSVASYFIQAVDDFGVAGLIEAEARWGGRRILNEIAMEQIRLDIQEAISRAYDYLNGEARLGSKFA